MHLNTAAVGGQVVAAAGGLAETLGTPRSDDRWSGQDRGLGYLPRFLKSHDANWRIGMPDNGRGSM